MTTQDASRSGTTADAAVDGSVESSVEGSVRAYARMLQPAHASLDDWLAWPPDAFALTSLVLRNTGAYRRVLADAVPRTKEQQRSRQRAAHAWVVRVNDALEPPGRAPSAPAGETGGGDALRDASATIERHWQQCTMEELRVLGTERAQQLAEALLALHAIADEACGGFGLPGGLQPWNALFHLVANLLLTARGTLTTLPKHLGVVLPKMRTPQSGLTLRSLSHHLTCHATEVEVVWRAIPWINVPRDTVNILAIPDPPDVTPRCFEAGADTLESVRYFTYVPDAERQRHSPAQIAALIARTSIERGHLHLVVLPELALDEDGYHELLLRLRDASDRGRLDHVPMVVTGVRTHVPRQMDAGRATDDASRETENEVHLAAYFAGRWYKMSQRKHHRWRLDRNQIRQYRFESRLSTSFAWYERITIAQRRLSFLAATDVLVLSPLICEDLAQLEPVSELIRGVGPTLLTALLMDGPQLEERWPARYASVFADDPGTAVLTLTSLGMSARSQRREEGGDAADRRRVVALWRDPESGTRLFKLPDAPTPASAFLLTVAATKRTEYAADGRVDGGMAGVFRFDGAWMELGMPSEAESGCDLSEPVRALLGRGADDERRRELLGDGEDLRGLSVAVFALDAMLELGGPYVELVKELALGQVPAAWQALSAGLARVVGGIAASLQDPAVHGGALASAGPTQPATPSLEQSTARLARFFAEEAGAAREASATGRIRYYMALGRRALEQLPSEPPAAASADRLEGGAIEEMRDARLQRAVPRAVLVAVHQRLEAFRGELLEDRPVAGTALARTRAGATTDGSTAEETLRDAGTLLGHIERALGLSRAGTAAR